MKLEDEDYWNESETTGFSFDDDEVRSDFTLLLQLGTSCSGQHVRSR